MKKVIHLAIVLTVCAFAAGMIPLPSSLGAPQAEAAGCYRCHCAFTSHTTDDVCVDGSTCAVATAILQNTLASSTGCESFCESTLNITMACTPNGGGGYWVCGTLTYTCEICIDLCE
jgi:hypothetical protein